MQSIKVMLKTLSPVVVSMRSGAAVMTETQEFFSGSILRGVFAGRYIAVRGLGKKAHEDEAFRRLFCGDLRFLPAYPAIGDMRSYVLPLSLQKDKAGNELRDLMNDLPEAGYKNCQGFGTVTSDGIVQTAHIRTELSLHMSRSGDTERIAGRSADGNIYNYEAIAPGQTFAGMIIGSDADLEELRTALCPDDRPMHCYIGRSRHTQYGKCELTFSAPAPCAAGDIPALQDEALYLRLDTPFLPLCGCCNHAGNALREIVSGLGEDVRLDTARPIFSAAQEADNFVGIWGLRRPRAVGLAAGTVFAVRKSTGAWSAEELRRVQELCARGFGRRMEEGFGQVRLWTQHPQLTMADSGLPEEKNADKGTVGELHKKVRGGVQRILKERCIAQFRLYAMASAETMSLEESSNHVFARLAYILQADRPHWTQKDFQERFTAEMEGAGDTFKNNLAKLRPDGGRSIDKILQGDMTQLYKEKLVSWHEAAFGEKAGAAKELIDAVGFRPEAYADELCRAYWQTFLRHARKHGNAGKKEGAQ